MAPMTPEGQRLWARNKKGIAESDPTINRGLNCMPPGFPRSTMGIQPVGIFQSAQALAMTGEGYDGQLHDLQWKLFT